ncbi:hypothetical protein BGZ68_002527 [Mortierella alpina]|nr:hypothetical protein BGZ68_002527 [Mortierella alpina]
MVIGNNKSAVFLKEPSKYPVAGEHIGVQLKQLNTDLRDGQVLLRNLYISLDPYLRNRMKDVVSYVPSFKIGEPLDSHGIAEVVESKNSKWPVGSLVVGPAIRWEERSVVDANAELEIIPPESLDPRIPLSAYIGVLGMPGYTAYGSLLEIGKPKAGETIFISAASGAVGQLVGQIAKLNGLRVIGSAGSDEKVTYLLKELKFDAAFNYKRGSILENLRAAAPEGIDIYYENVGGETLEAVLEVIKVHGRIIACGMISEYNNGKDTYNVKNLVNIVMKRLKVEGFLVFEFGEAVKKQFESQVSEWLKNGEIVYREDIAQGLDNAPEAFVGLFQGRNFGKGVVKIADL